MSDTNGGPILTFSSDSSFVGSRGPSRGEMNHLDDIPTQIGEKVKMTDADIFGSINSMSGNNILIKYQPRVAFASSIGPTNKPELYRLTVAIRPDSVATVEVTSVFNIPFAICTVYSAFPARCWVSDIRGKTIVIKCEASRKNEVQCSATIFLMVRDGETAICNT